MVIIFGRKFMFEPKRVLIIVTIVTVFTGLFIGLVHSLQGLDENFDRLGAAVVYRIQKQDSMHERLNRIERILKLPPWEGNK